jgi:lipoprotein-anchoring transpeptidase ErfK/SrfK
MRQAIRHTVTVAALAVGLFVTTPAAAQTTERRVIVSLADRKLALIVNGEVVRVFPVAVGASVSPSPVGRFTIVNRLTDPTYYRPGKVIGPGPANPLGTRWIGLDRVGYGIHGTDQPDSIGYARSHGCIRLRNSNIEELFPLLRVGDVVELIDQEPAASVASTETLPAPTASSR